MPFAAGGLSLPRRKPNASFNYCARLMPGMPPFTFRMNKLFSGKKVAIQNGKGGSRFKLSRVTSDTETPIRHVSAFPALAIFPTDRVHSDMPYFFSFL
jgi:hypothetical protein